MLLPQQVLLCTRHPIKSPWLVRLHGITLFPGSHRSLIAPRGTHYDRRGSSTLRVGHYRPLNLALRNRAPISAGCAGHFVDVHCASGRTRALLKIPVLVRLQETHVSLELVEDAVAVFARTLMIPCARDPTHTLGTNLPFEQAIITQHQLLVCYHRGCIPMLSGGCALMAGVNWRFSIVRGRDSYAQSKQTSANNPGAHRVGDARLLGRGRSE